MGIKSPLFPEEKETQDRYRNAHNFRIGCLSSIAALFTSLAVALTGIHYSLYFLKMVRTRKVRKTQGNWKIL